MNNWKKYLAAVYIVLFSSCGLPDIVEIPESPISVDSTSSKDNNLVFKTPNDDKITRYIVWYKIYPYISKTNTNKLIDADEQYFVDSNQNDDSDEIRKKDFHELYLSANVNDGYYFRGIAINKLVTITKLPGDTGNYIRVSVEGGSSPYNVRRNVAVSTTDSSRKSFYGEYNLSSDRDIKGRKSSDFSEYAKNPVYTSFVIAFMAQSAYIDEVELAIVKSPLTYLGFIDSDNGFFQ